MKGKRRTPEELDAGGRNGHGRRHSDEVAGSIRGHLLETREVIHGLRRDLDYYRTQSQRLLKERDDLSDLRGRLGTREEQLADLEDEVRFIRGERNGLADTLESLKDENEQLSKRCARLEAALGDERTQHQEAQEVIVYLEAQVRELQSIVDLLQEHKAFVRDETDE